MDGGRSRAGVARRSEPLMRDRPQLRSRAWGRQRLGAGAGVGIKRRPPGREVAINDFGTQSKFKRARFFQYPRVKYAA